MELTSKWDLKAVTGRQTFKDKNNIVRENVINTIMLEFTAEFDNHKETALLPVRLNMTDLSNFVEIEDFTKEQLIELALSVANSKEVAHIENKTKRSVQRLPEENIVTFNFD